MKGISEIIASVILLAAVVLIGVMVSPWIYNMATSMTNQTADKSNTQILCSNTAYDFDTDYGSYGLLWNFTGTRDYLRAKIINTGSINLYNFSFEVQVNDNGEYLYYFDTNSTTQRTSGNPLKPGQSAILNAIISQDINGTLEEVKILNIVCPSVVIKQEI